MNQFAEHDQPDDEAFLDDDHPRERRRGCGCLVALLTFVVLLGALWFGGNWAIDKWQGHFSSAADYSGSGHGQVIIQVPAGSTASDIGRELKSKDVVKSVEAFTEEATQNPKSTGIQVGYYQMHKQMAAKEALALLIDPKNQIHSLVTIPEGTRVRQVVPLIAKNTHIKAAAVEQALAKPQDLGLPADAHGNPEGYLFPATYTVPPGQTATELLREMVRKSEEVQTRLGVAAKAQQLGLTPEQVLTVASILEYEANRKVDYPKVARVLYNRLDKHMTLALDSTVAYVSGRRGDVWTTDAERADTSAYNTYVHQGLPPGPIGNPGETTIKAALNPADGPWLFFLPDFERGTTLYYAQDGPKRQADLERIKAYCVRTQNC